MFSDCVHCKKSVSHAVTVCNHCGEWNFYNEEGVAKLAKGSRVGLFRKRVDGAEPDIDALAEVRDLETVEKSVGAFMKHAEGATQRAARLFADVCEHSGLSIVAFSETDAGIELQGAYNEARKLFLEGPGAGIAKAAEAVIEKLETEIAARVEKMSLDHNLDEHGAKKRLEEISPSFRELVAKHGEAHKVRRAAIEKAQALVDDYHVSSTRQAERTAKAAVTKRDEAEASARKRALMVPSEAKVFEKAEALAAEKHIALSAAILEITSSDPEGIRLASAAKRERELRMAGAR